MLTRRNLRAVCWGLILLGLSGNAWSQSARTIKIIVPFPPGGTATILARLLAEQISKIQGPTILIENRPGAGASIGYEAIACAVPDGNTLGISGNSIVINPILRKVNYDPLTSFEPICYLVSSPQLIVVSSASPYRTLTDFMNVARAKPGELSHSFQSRQRQPLLRRADAPRKFAGAATPAVVSSTNTVQQGHRGGR